MKLITKYTIWKHEIPADTWHEVEVFTADKAIDAILCFQSAVARLFELQYEKTGEWIDDFTFATDFFTYTVYQSFDSKTSWVVSNQFLQNKERFNSLTQQAA